MTTATTNDKIITIRCRAFSGEGVRENQVMVAADGTIRVWDSVAGHYTTCHALSDSAIRRIRKAAQRKDETMTTTIKFFSADGTFGGDVECQQMTEAIRDGLAEHFHDGGHVELWQGSTRVFDDPATDMAMLDAQLAAVR